MSHRYTRYHIVFTETVSGADIRHKYFRRIRKARRFIELNFPRVLTCWREHDDKRANKIDIRRVFRMINLTEPLDFWNNSIRARVNRPR